MSGLGHRLARLAGDARLAARTLGKAPTFTAIAVLTLGIAIGANTAIFSIVDAVLIAPLPLPEADRLVVGIGTDEAGRRRWFSYPDFEDFRASSRTLTSYSAFVPQSVNLTGREQPERVRGGFVSDNFFTVTGVEPAIGRGFRREVDDREGAERVCVLQHQAWQRVFGSDAEILGSVLQLNNEPFTVIGILPEGFRFPFDDVDVWIPHHHWPVFRGAVADGRVASRAYGLVGGVGRLRPNVTLAEAEADLRAIFERLSRAHPEAGVRSASLAPMRELVVGSVRQPILVLFGAVGLVLLIACANVAGLLLVRTANRRQELATRAALGAGRGRIAAQLIVESAVLWTASGALGLVLGIWFRRLLLAAAPDSLPAGLTADLDAGVVGFLLAITALTAVAFGSIPALRGGSADPATALAAGARGSLGVSDSHRLRSGLVAAQVALTLVLLVGSGLLLRSFLRLTRVDTGFRAAGVLSMEYRLPSNKYAEPATQWDVHRRILESVRQVPGARAAALVSGLPFSGNGSTLGFRVVGGEPTEEAPRARALTVSDGYFETLGIALLRGRTLTADDHADAPPVVVVSKSLAEQFFSGEEPLGRRLAIGSGDEPSEAEIVGVVADTKQYGLDETELPAIYGVQAQNPGIFNTLAVRTDGDPLRLAERVRAALWSVDSEQPVWKIRTLESLVERSVGLPRFLARLMAAYAGVALLLAAIGIYGVVATLVAQRRREIGLRMALGALRRDVLRLVVGHGLRWTAIGIVAGVAASLALGRVLHSLLYSTESTDPLTLGVVSTLVSVVALAASFLPARAATSIDPARTLRAE